MFTFLFLLIFQLGNACVEISSAVFTNSALDGSCDIEVNLDFSATANSADIEIKDADGNLLGSASTTTAKTQIPIINCFGGTLTIEVQGYKSVGGKCGSISSYEIGLGLLPVELSYFQVTAKGEHALLKWETIAEIDNDFFIVEHSSNGIDFTEIAIEEGAGTSNRPSYYNFEHDGAKKGNNYYRIVPVSFAGVKTASATKELFLSGDALEVLSFNDKAGKTEIVMLAENKEEISWYVHDLSGRQLQHGNLRTDKGENRVELSIPASGMYIFSVSNGQMLTSQKFVKH